MKKHYSESFAKIGQFDCGISRKARLLIFCFFNLPMDLTISKRDLLVGRNGTTCLYYAQFYQLLPNRFICFLDSENKSVTRQSLVGALQKCTFRRAHLSSEHDGFDNQSVLNAPSSDANHRMRAFWSLASDIPLDILLRACEKLDF